MTFLEWKIISHLLENGFVKKTLLYHILIERSTCIPCKLGASVPKGMTISISSILTPRWMPTMCPGRSTPLMNCRKQMLSRWRQANKKILKSKRTIGVAEIWVFLFIYFILCLISSSCSQKQFHLYNYTFS